MNWIEELAVSGDKWAEDVVIGSFCEPLITTFQDKLPNTYPFMGKKTQEICRSLAPHFRLRESTMQILNSSL